jgi:hypothetical protein
MFEEVEIFLAIIDDSIVPGRCSFEADHCNSQSCFDVKLAKLKRYQRLLEVRRGLNA